jgi:excisionase family DNA binding protein
LLRLSEAAIYRLIKKDKIPYIALGGVFRFDLDVVNKWIEDGGTRGKDK